MKRSDFEPLAGLYREIMAANQTVIQLSEVKRQGLRAYAINFEGMQGAGCHQLVYDKHPLDGGMGLLDVLLDYHRTRLKTMQAVLDDRLDAWCLHGNVTAAPPSILAVNSYEERDAG